VRVLVDTPIWSLALRRPPRELNPSESHKRAVLAELVRDGRTMIIGPIRQEVLSGIREQEQFNRLRESLRAFLDEPLTTAHYEEAAQMGNQCSAEGIATTPVDMLVCAAAIQAKAPIFTSDREFLNYSKVLLIHLFQAQ